ncbi:hypothetical protein [Cupriavidus sp. DL-D2]|uniref:hypothetical protein n=1 Tax=Cupriavidus sp. DL-D2 TaxID=3144974 RepID=UPI0032147EA2
MSQIGSITQIHSTPRYTSVPPQSEPVTAQTAANDADGQAPGVEDTERPPEVKGTEAGASGEKKSAQSETADSIKAQIEQMQKQLAELREHLQAVQSEQRDEREKAAMVASMETQMAMLQSSIMVATMKLAEAMANEGSDILDRTGGYLPPAR